MSSGKIYWADSRTPDSDIRRVNVGGTGVEVIVNIGASKPQGIAVDESGGKIYWTTQLPSKIQRSNLDGTNIEDIVTEGLEIPVEIAVDPTGGKIYWADRGIGIQRANLDGTNVEIIKNSINVQNALLDVIHGKIYWGQFPQKIRRANLDGSGFTETFATTGTGFFQGMVVDPGGGKLYWTQSEGKIQRKSLDRTGGYEDIITGLRSPRHITFDFDTTAGAVALIDENPSLTWNYELTHNSGAIEEWTYTGNAITEADVSGVAEAAGWSVASRTDTDVTFSTTTPLVSGSVDGFHIAGTGGGTGIWTAGSNTGSTDGPLPVELTQFFGSATTGGIFLRWRTASETNNLGFEVYRSQTKDGEYFRITPTLIKGHGTDSTPHDYSFLDETAEEGQTYWYLIEDVDFSGNGERSEPIQVVFDLEVVSLEIQPDQFALHQNYPNPFNPETWIPYDLAEEAPVKITIYNASGKIIRTFDLGTQPAGSYVARNKAAYWDGRNDADEQVADGIYFYQFQAADYSATKKMIITK